MSRPATPRRARRAWWALAALTLAIGGLRAPTAAAQDGAEGGSVAEARRHFRQGVALFNDGDLEAALMEFRTSHRLNPLPAVLYNIALVERDLHRYAHAAATLRRYLAEGTAEPERRRADAEELVEEIEALLATVVIACDQPGASVFVDGELAGRTPLDAPLRLSTGRHELEVRLEGHEPFTQSLEVYGGQRLDLTVELQQVRTPTPWYRTWWFWTIVGVVAAGSVAAIAGSAASQPAGAEFDIDVVAAPEDAP